MKKLSREASERAQMYIMAHARKVDKARYDFFFRGGDRQEVIVALARYQNEDGGFGHGLEPDVRTEASSAIATATGLTILREVGAGDAEIVLQKAIAYLLHTFDHVRYAWPIVPPEVEQAPHAPWWSYADAAQNFGQFLANPRAAVVGHLCHYQTLVPLDFLTPLAQATVAHLESLPDRMEMHDLLCYLELASAGNVPADLRQRVVAKLLCAVPATVVTDPTRWGGYGLLPLDVAPSPAGPFAQTLAPQAIQANLDLLIDSQLPDGSWPLAWSWAQVDAPAWTRAELGWKGYLAVNKLRTLAAYGRLEDRV